MRAQELSTLAPYTYRAFETDAFAYVSPGKIISVTPQKFMTRQPKHYLFIDDLTRRAISSCDPIPKLRKAFSALTFLTMNT